MLEPPLVDPCRDLQVKLCFTTPLSLQVNFHSSLALLSHLLVDAIWFSVNHGPGQFYIPRKKQ